LKTETLERLSSKNSDLKLRPDNLNYWKVIKIMQEEGVLT
jgi:hypothetical protein